MAGKSSASMSFLTELIRRCRIWLYWISDLVIAVQLHFCLPVQIKRLKYLWAKLNRALVWLDAGYVYLAIGVSNSDVRLIFWPIPRCPCFLDGLMTPSKVGTTECQHNNAVALAKLLYQPWATSRNADALVIGSACFHPVNRLRS